MKLGCYKKSRQFLNNCYAMRNEKELTRNKKGFQGNAEGPIKIGEHGYLVVPVCKVVTLPRCA